jgi:hypothetical protein
MAVTNLPHALGIAGRGRNTSTCCANHWLEDEGRDGVCTMLEDRIFEFLGAGVARRIGSRALNRAVAVGW